MNVIYRYEVPVDGNWHEHRCGEPLHVGCRDFSVVEFWAHPTDELRQFRVVGTGHEPPDGPLTYRGTAVAGSLVWHLLERARGLSS